MVLLPKHPSDMSENDMRDIFLELLEDGFFEVNTDPRLFGGR